MLVSGIKSKPVYAPLRADMRGRWHLMLGVGEGESSLLRVLREMQSEAPQALGATTVLLAPAPRSAVRAGRVDANANASAGADAGERGEAAIERGATDSRTEFDALPLQAIRSFGEVAALLRALEAMLESARMGTRLYVAGPESFIGLAMKIALEFNLNKDEVRAEQVGSLARRVYCIHCRTTTENVRTNIVRCVNCERWLLVRDHYSRRLAAYMGVMVDAEVPGELPPIREVFV
jgi:hypothetical protein